MYENSGPPAPYAHAYCNKCALSVDCRLKFNFSIFSFSNTSFKVNGLILSGEGGWTQAGYGPDLWYCTLQKPLLGENV